VDLSEEGLESVEEKISAGSYLGTLARAISNSQTLNTNSMTIAPQPQTTEPETLTVNLVSANPQPWARTRVL